MFLWLYCNNNENDIEIRTFEFNLFFEVKKKSYSEGGKLIGSMTQRYEKLYCNNISRGFVKHKKSFQTSFSQIKCENSAIVYKWYNKIHLC